jgi:hypothetical protein
MYSPRYIQYLNFPQIPKHILDALIKPEHLVDLYKSAVMQNKRPAHLHDTYVWSNELNEQIDAWGKENICPDMYYAFQVLSGPLPIHKDNGTNTKLNYIIAAGGNNVVTEFYDDDKTTCMASYCIPEHCWHIFKADTYHSVINIEPGQYRFGITARIFGQQS